MSTYYTYYLGYTKDKQIYPLGPFDNTGRFFSVVSNSRSFASEFWQCFYTMQENDVTISEELKHALCKNWDTDITDTDFEDLRWIPIDEVPKNLSNIEEGYFLIDDVKHYLDHGYDDFDIFYEKMTPLEYAERCRNEITFGLPPTRKDAEGGEFVMHSCSDYMYFRYAKNRGFAKEVNNILHVYDMLTKYVCKPKGVEYVVICSIG